MIMSNDRHSADDQPKNRCIFQGPGSLRPRLPPRQQSGSPLLNWSLFRATKNKGVFFTLWAFTE